MYIDTRSDVEIRNEKKRGTFTMFMVVVSCALLILSYEITAQGGVSLTKFFLAELVSLIPGFVAIGWDSRYSRKIPTKS